jgi:RHS repeat-associated protein
VALKSRYYSVDGAVIAERTTGGGRTDYGTDALGSVTATAAAGGTASSRYSPYGEQGTAPTGATLGWVGTWGYRPTARSVASHYVRARHYASQQGQWTSVDPLWPQETAYVYVGGCPINGVDPSGKNWEDCPPAQKADLRKRWLDMRDRVKKLCPDPNKPPKTVIDCWKNCGDSRPNANAECMCKHGSDIPGFGIRFRCKTGSPCEPKLTNPLTLCDGACMCTDPGSASKDCRTYICLANCTSSQLTHLDEAYFHEMLHCCNARHKYNKHGGDVEETTGVPGPGGLGANILCLLNCLRPLLGLKAAEPWVTPPMALCPQQTRPW